MARRKRYNLTATDFYGGALVLWVVAHVRAGNANDNAHVPAGEDLGLDGDMRINACP
jgi:hypothetical protein